MTDEQVVALVLAKMESLMQPTSTGKYMDATETWNTLLQWLHNWKTEIK